MDDTPNLALPYIIAAQAQKHVTHNEALRALDAIVQLMVLDRDLASPPGSPAAGDRYIVAASPSGAWSGQAGKIAACQDGAWAFYAPREGWLAWVADENAFVVYDGGAWAPFPVSELQNAELLGINATADATNRLALKSPASLFDAEEDDHRQKINKVAAGDTASQLFQSGYSGRAEYGLIGNDDFTVKVSPDGDTWFEAFIVDKDTGEARFPNTSFADVQEFTSSGTWTKPAGAVKVLVQIISGGGGGGGGARVTSGNPCSGGGGGGAGFYAERWFNADWLGSTETVTIGAAGTGGTGATSDDTAGGNGSGGGGAGGQNADTGRTGGVSMNGAGGGGSGGGMAASPGNLNGGGGGRNNDETSSASFGGVAPGGNGSTGTNLREFKGSGGGGGANNTGGNGGNGGVGMNYGAGGGGGGSAIGGNGGSGADGAPGFVRVTTFF